MATTPKHAIGSQGITINLKPEDLAELDLEIQEKLAACPAAKLARATWAGHLIREHLKERRATRAPAPVEPTAPPEPRGRKAPR